MSVRGIFGRNVARLRAAAELSQVQLAAALDADGTGISQSYVSQLEAGKRNPKLETIVAIALALQVPVGEVVAGCDEADAIGRPSSRSS